MALDLTNIAAVETRINELKIPIAEGPITLPDGGIMFFIRDPDRDVIEFHQPPPA
jgi:lactoylglutathione lyase